MQNHLLSGKPFRKTFLHISTMFAFLFVSATFAQGVSNLPPTGELKYEFLTRPDQARGMVFLPDSRLLFTDRTGNLRVLNEDYSSSKSLKGTPDALAPENGGTMDIAVDPQFTRNSFVYFSFSETDENKEKIPAIGRAELTDDELRNFEVIFRHDRPAKASDLHSGQILFTPEGRLMFATGELVVLDPEEEQNILRVDLESIMNESSRFADSERRERRDLMIWEPEQ